MGTKFLTFMSMTPIPHNIVRLLYLTLERLKNLKNFTRGECKMKWLGGGMAAGEKNKI